MMRRVVALGSAAFLVLGAGADTPPAKPPVPRLVQQMAPEQTEPILGRPVNGSDGKELGRLVDVLVTSEGTPQAAVIDFGGFLGVGNRRIAVRWDTMHFTPTDPQHAIVLDMTMDEIKAAPAYGSSATKPVQVVTPEPVPDPATADTAPKRDAPAATEPAVTGPAAGPAAAGPAGAGATGAGPSGSAPADSGSSGSATAAPGSAAGTAGGAAPSGDPAPASGATPSASGTTPSAGGVTPSAPAAPGAGAGSTPPAAEAAPATGQSESATSPTPR